MTTIAICFNGCIINSVNEMNKELTREMIKYLNGDVKRINHMLKVRAFPNWLPTEKNRRKIKDILLSAAAVHDIGIHICEKKYGSTAGTYQEKEGPSEARKLMTSLGFSKDDIERVCYLVAHHHTYTDDMSPDYRILIEADFIVNAFEDSLDKKAVSAARKNIFRTETGKKLLDEMYLEKHCEE